MREIIKKVHNKFREDVINILIRTKKKSSLALANEL
ncbi:hypothetical protein AB751O23_CF_00040 [Chlamydiales bacterium SCGC AB-751-O23]|nr:hypothetical protein AB751O23_CF_00040 [Chlamydiales bacterium SCGC AB-751-O23]